MSCMSVSPKERLLSRLSQAGRLALAVSLILSTVLVCGPPPTTATPTRRPPASASPSRIDLWHNVPVEAGTQPAINSTTSLTHTVFLPLVSKAYGLRWDRLNLEWAQSVGEGDERAVLLAWRTPEDVLLASPMALTQGVYYVYRRPAGDKEWQLVAETRPAPDAAEFAAIVGQPLMDQLAWDLRDSTEDAPLTPQQIYDKLRTDLPLARAVAGQYYEIGKGLGLAFLDGDPPPDKTVEYRVERRGADGYSYGPVSIKPAATLPPVLGLREVWPGPGGLGQCPSSRPDDAEERYHWDASQRYRSWDGAVYLIWDLPQESAQAAADTQRAEDQFKHAGYNVYRARPGTNDWELVNARRKCHTTLDSRDRYCTYLVRASALPVDRHGEIADDAYFFKEDLKAVYSDPADIYTDWSYRVCPVDHLGQEGGCSDPLGVSVRELDSPAAVGEIEVDVPPDHSSLTLRWTYSDTTELSSPLRFYVTRSPSTTLPAEQWTPVIPAGATEPYIEVGTTTPLTMTIEDKPPRGEVHWYRVQVRDDAGNWSAPSAPAKGALYPRTPPPFSAIPHDPDNCALNDMPLSLHGLDERVLQIALYRSFSPTGPWQLIERLTVTDGQVTVDDDYLPPYPVDVYYRLEAIDGYGNVSEAQRYCAHLNPGTVPPAPTNVGGEVGEETPDHWTAEIGWDAFSGESQVSITQPGVDGNTTTTETVAGDSLSGVAHWGAWVVGTVSGVNENGAGEEAPFFVRNTNDFLDTKRQMTDMGRFHDAEWTTTSGGHAVRITVHRSDMFGNPLGAAFRRIPNGNWLQVTPVQKLRRGDPSEPMVITDTADLSVNQGYEYVVLAFSPTSYEVLGYWGGHVSPLTSTPELIELTERISPVPRLPGGCSFDRYSPESLNMPDQIYLHNGWVITDLQYWRSDDPLCPGRMQRFDPAHAYGDGQLSNGSQTWPVRFFDIGVNQKTGVHENNRITAKLNVDVLGRNRFNARFGYVEFQPGQARAEVTLTLPENIKVVDADTDERSHKLFGLFDDVTTDLIFDPLYINSTVAYLLDENLPWQILGDLDIGPGEVELGEGGGLTLDRLGYTPPTISHPAAPDNNLGFMRASYQSSNAYVDPDGLYGDFVTSEAISYSTSLPAAVVINAVGGASITVQGSRIQSGSLLNSVARLDYLDRGTITDYAVPGASCSEGGGSATVLCSGWLAVCPRLHHKTLIMDPVAGTIPIEQDGRLRATVTLDRAPTWLDFEVDTNEATLYVAAAAFEDAPTSWAPMPAENAWRQLDEPLTRGDLDPGVNINAVGGSLGYDFFDPPDFDNVDMDLYIRRGGVSEYLLILPGGASSRTNEHNYRVDVVRIELVFVDNAIVEGLDWRTGLHLPYPSDVAVALKGDVLPCGAPTSGEIISPTTVLHRYWRFEHRPTDWRYSHDLQNYGGALRDQTALFELSGEGVINGLNNQSTSEVAAPVRLPVRSQWLPDGDYGDIKLETDDLPDEGYRVSGIYFAFTDVKLSRYHSTPLDKNSLPDTLGLDLSNNMGQVPADLLDASGNLTPQSLLDCSESEENRVGCGFVVLDGEGAVEYFGEIGRQAGAMALSNVPGDALQGDFPIVNNDLIPTTTQMVIAGPQVNWDWPQVNEVLDLDIPVKFMGNEFGGALVGVFTDTSVLPGLEVFRADVAAVVTVDWNGTRGYDDKIGILAGYTASQAAFRALAMNRPDPDGGGTLPFDLWADVEDDVKDWAGKFGYTDDDDRSDKDDPIDLASEIWEKGWCGWDAETMTCTQQLEFDRAYQVLEPVLRDRDGAEAYGVTGLEAGRILEKTDTELNTGLGQAIFVIAGGDLRLDSLSFGAQVKVGDGDDDSDDKLFDAKWISLEYNRDGEIILEAEGMDIVLTGDYDVTANLMLLVGTAEGSERLEGSIILESLEISEMTLSDLGVTFGAGRIEGEVVAYLGLQGEAEFSGYEVGGALLFGSIYPQSQVLRHAGYGDLLDSLGGGDTPSTFIGVYLAFHGEFPLVDEGCMLEATAGGDLRFWYFWDTTEDRPIYGGQLSGHAEATVACVLSGRAQLSLTLAEVNDGGTVPPPPGEDATTWPLPRTCQNPHGTCTAFVGDFWVAVGFGWCSPSSWHSWGSRWWGDSWCYCIGAWAAVSYLDPAPGSTWQQDYDLDYE